MGEADTTEQGTSEPGPGEQDTGEQVGRLGRRFSPWTAANISDQSGRVAIVTGANTGLGYEVARELAGHGARVVLACRNLDKARVAAGQIAAAEPGARAECMALDLSSLASVRTAASEIADRYPRVDLLVNNAGVMMTPYDRTRDGFELQFGTNHLGPFALTGLILPALLATPGSRVVTVSSNGHKLGRINFGDLQSEHHYGRGRAYAQSKLANLMFTYELQRRLAAAHAPVIAVAAHPGTASTELERHLPGPLRFVSSLSPRQGAAAGALPLLRAATEPRVGGGEYYGPGGFGEFTGFPRVVSSTSRSRDRAAQRRLWSVSEELTGVTYSI